MTHLLISLAAVVVAYIAGHAYVAHRLRQAERKAPPGAPVGDWEVHHWQWSWRTLQPSCTFFYEGEPDTEALTVGESAIEAFQVCQIGAVKP